jgi:hypothetical protein
MLISPKGQVGGQPNKVLITRLGEGDSSVRSRFKGTGEQLAREEAVPLAGGYRPEKGGERRTGPMPCWDVEDTEKSLAKPQGCHAAKSCNAGERSSLAKWPPTVLLELQ